MRVPWLIGAFIIFVIGYILANTWLGWIIGVPLIALSVFLVVIGLILPDKHY